MDDNKHLLHKSCQDVLSEGYTYAGFLRRRIDVVDLQKVKFLKKAPVFKKLKQFKISPWIRKYVVLARGCVFLFSSDQSKSCSSLLPIKDFNSVMTSFDVMWGINLQCEDKDGNVDEKSITHFSASNKDEQKKWHVALRNEIASVNGLPEQIISMERVKSGGVTDQELDKKIYEYHVMSKTTHEAATEITEDAEHLYEDVDNSENKNEGRALPPVPTSPNECPKPATPNKKQLPSPSMPQQFFDEDSPITPSVPPRKGKNSSSSSSVGGTDTMFPVLSPKLPISNESSDSSESEPDYLECEEELDAFYDDTEITRKKTPPKVLPKVQKKPKPKGQNKERRRKEDRPIPKERTGKENSLEKPAGKGIKIPKGAVPVMPLVMQKKEGTDNMEVYTDAESVVSTMPQGMQGTGGIYSDAQSLDDLEEKMDEALKVSPRKSSTSDEPKAVDLTKIPPIPKGRPLPDVPKRSSAAPIPPQKSWTCLSAFDGDKEEVTRLLKRAKKKKVPTATLR